MNLPSSRMDYRTAVGLLAGGAFLAGVLRGARSANPPLRGRRVLITGGSRGLGLALAQACARQGAHLILCARDRAELERAQRGFLPPGTEVELEPCDLDSPPQIRAMFARLRASERPIDLLINNAGVIEVGPIDAIRASDFESVLRTNLMGMIRVTLESIPLMRRGSSIANICSIGGAVAIPHLLPYSTSKFGAVGFSMGLDAELAGKGIAVTTVLPGPMRTGSFVQARFRGDAIREFDWFALGSALPGLSISAERAASRVLDAVARRKRFAVVGAPAKALRLLSALLPGTTLGVMRAASALMPQAHGGSHARGSRKGRELRIDLPRGGLTRLGDRAGDRLNENPESA